MANGSSGAVPGAQERRADRPTDPLALVAKDSTYVYYIGQGHYVEIDPGRRCLPIANRGRNQLEGQFSVRYRRRPASPGRLLPGVCGTLSFAAHHADRAVSAR